MAKKELRAPLIGCLGAVLVLLPAGAEFDTAHVEIIALPAPVSELSVEPGSIARCETSTADSLHRVALAPRAVDIMLLADGSWGPYTPTQALNAMEGFLDALLDPSPGSLGADIDARIGIMYLGTSREQTFPFYEVLTPPIADHAHVVARWRELPSRFIVGEFPDYEGAIAEAQRILQSGAASRPAYTERILIWVGDGSENWSAQQLSRLVKEPKRQGTRVMAICFYRHPLCTTYEATTSSPADYIVARRPAEYDASVAELAERIVGPRIVSATVTHRLAPAVAVVPGSVVPPPTYASGDGRELRWTVGAPVPDLITATYRLAPLVDVFRGTAVTATLTLTDDVGAARVVDVTTAALEVTGPCAPTATATPTASATPTPTGVPPDTATPRPTATPTPTATRAPRPIYLPVTLGEPACEPGRQRIDVALVLDASTSMAEPTRAGRRKIEAALEAAGAFLDLLALRAAGADRGDRAAIVAFNADAWTLAPLTGDRAALEAALGRVALAQQTRLDRAAMVGAEALAAGAADRAGNVPVLVLLTDGRANPVPVDAAVAEAAAAKAAGVVVFTIGLGEDLDAAALAAMASAPEGFLHAPDAEDLAAAYAEVARSIPCGPGRLAAE